MRFGFVSKHTFSLSYSRFSSDYKIIIFVLINHMQRNTKFIPKSALYEGKSR